MWDDLVKRLREGVVCVDSDVAGVSGVISESKTDALCDEAADRIVELSAKLAKAVAIAKDAIETMEEGPFFPEREGQRLLAALAELKGQDDG